MGHAVTGLVGKMETLERFADKHSLHRPVSLAKHLAILPLRDDDIDSFLAPPLTGFPKGFVYLSGQLLRELEAASRQGILLYFETEYFGGVGAQGAAVFRDGALVFGPSSAERGPINQALAMLGVRVMPPARDEFETVGLHRRRHTEDWLETDGEDSG
jgi:hypothetical protein